MSQNCTDDSCPEVGIDCSSIFGKSAKHCTILCDGHSGCWGSAVSCPRHTKGSGSCTVICSGWASCWLATIHGNSVANLTVKCDGMQSCYEIEIHHFEWTAKFLEVLADGWESAESMYILYGGSNASETIIRCSPWDYYESDEWICPSLKADDSWGNHPS